MHCAPASFRLSLSITALLAASAAVRADLALEPVATGLTQPLYVGAPAGDDRLFVVEKTGAIKVLDAQGTLLPTPFLNLGAGGANLINTSGEQGLLGLAFDPAFATNGRFYVNYIAAGSQDTVVARYTLPDPAANTAAGATVDTILTIDQPANRTNHKAGWLGFRPGEPANLYIATGDGGSSNDPDNLAQNLNSNLGKVLRINVSGNGPGYAIPADNPFVGPTAGNDEVWAYGLRNPFRNSFDRDTGDFYIADVGQGTREEVNFEPAPVTPATAGRNYGWRPLEGGGDNPGVPDAAPPNAVGPIFDYLRGSSDFSPAGARSSITGGYVYRGDLLPELDGIYFFADYVTGKIGSFEVVAGVATNILDRTPELDPTGSLLGPNAIASFGEDADGELYIVDINGEVFRIIPEPATASLLAIALCASLHRGFRRIRSRR